MKLEDISGDDRTLVIVALQALCRERANAYRTACTACQLADIYPPDEKQFGIDEVMAAIRRVGAHPER